MEMLVIVNEDSTSIDNAPKNPLKGKWDKLYPPIPMPQYSQICDGYSCGWCGRCPQGSLWEVPKEDKAAWDKYQKQLLEYNKQHNPSMYS